MIQDTKNISVPVALHRQLKARALREQTTLAKLVAALLRKAVKRG